MVRDEPESLVKRDAGQRRRKRQSMKSVAPRIGTAPLEKPPRQSAPRMSGMDEERTNTRRVRGGIEQWIRLLLELVAAKQRLSFTPSARGCDLAGTLDHEVGAIVDQSRIDAEHMHQRRIDLGRRIPTLVQATHRRIDQCANGADVAVRRRAQSIFRPRIRIQSRGRD